MRIRVASREDPMTRWSAARVEHDQPDGGQREFGEHVVLRGWKGSVELLADQASRHTAAERNPSRGCAGSRRWVKVTRRERREVWSATPLPTDQNGPYSCAPAT
jgi:hypothetical protein